MVIYEVNLSIDKEVYSDFRAWLDEHIQLMLEFEGFLKATVMRETNAEEIDSQQVLLTVQYQINSAAELDNYFAEYAAKMRDDGLKKFAGRFNATRRIFDVEAVTVH